MPELCMRFYGLEPESALKLVAEFTSAEKQHRSLLKERTVSIRTSVTSFGTGVEILVVDYHTRRGHEAQKSALEAFAKYWEKLDRINCPESGLQPLLNALPSLLLACGMCENQFDPGSRRQSLAQQAHNQKLLVCWPQDSAHAHSLVQEARLVATSIRVATAESSNGDECLLIHLLDDPQRFSVFQSARIGNEFKDYVVLDGYKSERMRDERLIFLPENFTPTRSAFEHFFTILAAGHELFGYKEAPTSEVLAAVGWTQKDEQKPFLIYPGDVQFRTEGYFAPRSLDLASYEIVSLHESKAAMSRLRETISEASADAGYSLRLIPSRYVEANDAESDRLRIMRDEINERLAELSGLRPRRPTLLRFTQRDLKTLADTLRSYSVDKETLRHLHYGFYATTDRHPEGLHFLLLKHDVAPKTLRPWVDWPIKFWLDPHWAYHYHGWENHALVFVPYGTTLYPSMHSWGAAEMDEYLRDILGSRYHGELGVQKIPEKPIYLFDGEVGDENYLYLTILDQDDFEPLSERLGWLNENLMCLDYYGDAERFIKVMAATIEQDRIDETLVERAAANAEAFQNAAEQTAKRMATQTEDLVDGVSAGIDVILTDLEDFIEKAEVINHDLAALEELYKDMKAWTDRTTALRDRTLSQATEALEQHTRGITAQVEDAIAKAAAKRQKLETDLGRTIHELQTTRTRLHGMVQSLRDDGDRYDRYK